MSLFAHGTFVRVRDQWPPGHIRTPGYCRGRIGAIAQALGPYPNPEERAYRRSGTLAPTLYRVRFRQQDLWADYSGPAHDTLDIEIYDHWLEQVDAR